MKKSRILIVDDEPNLSDLVRLVLEKTERFEVRVENRSAQALVTARDFRPDMVLLDVDMPGKDGGEVAREIRSEPSLRGTPIVFLTSLISRTETDGQVTERGGMHFLSKPVKSAVLTETVDRMLAGKVATA